ncbi:unnamed protein product [Gemmata massiliana]|uniref:Uncharacterized protein n=1 Tax=Gemmata massiliana TaxID=1210884 RepID=A0A6P2DI46_9BACT|nr:hypothetical protein [Gemmata massiliana]VTS00999.1 unnamed protein product [Gemmata massiliana]
MNVRGSSNSAAPKLGARTEQGLRWALEYKFAYSSTEWNWPYYPDPSGTNAGRYNANNKEFQAADTLEDGPPISAGARDLNSRFGASAWVSSRRLSSR